MLKKYDVIEIANYSLVHLKYIEEKEVNIQYLVKLCILIQGYHLAIRDEVLFFNNIYNWEFGPIVSELYSSIRHYKNNNIPFDNIEYITNLDNYTKLFIRDICDKYIEYSGIELCNIVNEIFKEDTYNYKWIKSTSKKDNLFKIIPIEYIKYKFKAYIYKDS